MKATLLLVVGVLLGGSTARADQCQWLDDRAVAARALRELENHPEIITLCEPCGEVAPGDPRRAEQIFVRPVDDHASEVMIDGVGVDLAYTYVRTSEQQYRNLAALAGCATDGVSPSLRVDPAAGGVLIRADQAPPPIMPGLPVTSMPPVAAPVPAAPTILVVSPPAPWWLMLLFGYGAVITTIAIWATWRATRQRPVHTPRATRLVNRRDP